MRESEKRQIRWWPLWATWGLGVAGIIAGVPFSEEVSRQQGVMRNMAILAFCLTLSLLWLIAFSRLAWTARLRVLGFIGLVSIALISLFRYEGVSGDLIPIVKWRWSSADRSEIRDIEVKELVIDGTYPQFLGPARNATVTDLDLSLDWSTDEPELIWRQPIGEA